MRSRAPTLCTCAHRTVLVQPKRGPLSTSMARDPRSTRCSTRARPGGSASRRAPPSRSKIDFATPRPGAPRTLPPCIAAPPHPPLTPRRGQAAIFSLVGKELTDVPFPPPHPPPPPLHPPCPPPFCPSLLAEVSLCPSLFPSFPPSTALLSRSPPLVLSRPHSRPYPDTQVLEDEHEALLRPLEVAPPPPATRCGARPGCAPARA
jgi:hypothetical protein